MMIATFHPDDVTISHPHHGGSSFYLGILSSCVTHLANNFLHWHGYWCCEMAVTGVSWYLGCCSHVTPVTGEEVAKLNVWYLSPSHNIVRTLLSDFVTYRQ